MHILRLSVEKLDKHNAQRFEEAALTVSGVRRVDGWPGRADLMLNDPAAAPLVIAALGQAGFDAAELVQEAPNRVMKVRIDGMTCRSCEITVERRFKKISGVRKVDVDAAKGVARIVTGDDTAPDLEALQKAVEKDGYRIRGVAGAADGERPSALRVAGLFAVVLLLGALSSKLGLFDRSFTIGGKTTFLAALVLGLVAGSSSCVAVAGGLLLSSAAKFRERYGGRTAAGRLRPVFLFIAGRIAGYGLLGGTISLIGKSLTPSPLVTGAITVLAAAYMFIMGLDMLGVAPRWLIGLMPRMPKRIGHRIMDAEAREHPVMPALLGAATFFIPCGFTQSLQLYALTTGSFFAGASILAGFAIGTAPALLVLGAASSSLKGRVGKLFFQFAGALVVVLGLANIQNGFTAAGHPLSLPSFSFATRAAVPAAQEANDPNVAFDGQKQVIKMGLGIDPPYTPSDHYTVRAGVPLRMEISGVGTGCRSIFQIPQVGVRTALNQTLNVVEFTPPRPGTLTFSCSMGMFRGYLTVVPNHS